MKKRLIALALPLWVMQAYGQVTTYGPTDPVTLSGATYGDYSPDGTVIQAGGSVTLTNAASYHHNNLSFQNNGTWACAPGSLDLFEASGPVIISGSTAPNFSSLWLVNSNTLSITNAGGVNVSGQLVFSNTITTTVRASHTNGALRFADEAFYTSSLNDAHHVNGYVSKAGNDAFTFPVGSGTDIRTVSIAAPATNVTIATAWFAGSPATVTDPSDGSTHSLTAVADPIKAVAPVGFWDWANTAGSDDNVAVTVSIPDVSAFATPAALRLIGWNGTQWIALGASGAGTATENSALSGTIPAGVSITALAIGSVENPLPVTLVSFTGKAVEQTVALQWTTTEEINASHFEIQRSRDAKNFESIGKVDAQGDSRALVQYKFTDQTPLSGINYYRLKQIDRGSDGMDGAFAFSRTISVALDAAIEINVYPNPVTDVLRIESGVALQSLEVFHADGSKVTGLSISASGAATAASGKSFQEISLRNQKPGIYLLIINGKSFKILKD